MPFHPPDFLYLSMLSISIIVPVFDAELYVERCVRSVMAQTYTGDTECIIVDDGSTDGSMAKVKKLVDGYDGNIRFRLLAHDQNRGLSEARNTGINATSGDYLLFLDSDDELSIHALKLIAEAAENRPGTDIVAGEYYLCHEYAPYLRRNKYEHIDGNTECRRALLAEGSLLDTAHNKLLRREWINDNNLRFHPEIYYEDSLWKWDCAKCAGSITFLRKPTMVYFCNPGSIANGKTPKHLHDTLKVLEIKLGSIDTVMPETQLRNIATHYTAFLINLCSYRELPISDDTLASIENIAKQIRYKAHEMKSLRVAMAMAIVSLGNRLIPLSIKLPALRTARKIVSI